MCITVPTKRVENSDAEAVWAPIIRSSCIRHDGHHHPVRITDVEEEFKSLEDELINLTVCTIFSGEIFGVSSRSRVAYATEVAKALRDLGHTAQAEAFMCITGTFGFYVCKPRMFVFT